MYGIQRTILHCVGRFSPDTFDNTTSVAQLATEWGSTLSWIRKHYVLCLLSLISTPLPHTEPSIQHLYSKYIYTYASRTWSFFSPWSFLHHLEQQQHRHPLMMPRARATCDLGLKTPYHVSLATCHVRRTTLVLIAALLNGRRVLRVNSCHDRTATNGCCINWECDTIMVVFYALYHSITVLIRFYWEGYMASRVNSDERAA